MKPRKLLTLLLIAYSTSSFAQSITLDGKHLTINNVVSVARNNASVAINANALNSVNRSHALLLLAAKNNLPIYGVNRGVGMNKDKTIFQGDVLTPTARAQSEQFNINDIYATSAAVGDNAPRSVVRAAMLIRLNTLLLGHTGVQPAVVELLQAFLNNDITPIFPAGGSIGEADITILAHIGLAIMGKGEVLYHGKIMPAKQALALAKLTPVTLYAKDALSIFSSNAYTAGIVALAAYDTDHLLMKYNVLVGLSLEGINGNIAPLLTPVQSLRPYAGQQIAAQAILNNLQGSYLFNTADNRALQDPLSFRTASQVNGAAQTALKQLEDDLTLQINSSDDNPTVILDIKPRVNATPQEKSYYVSNGVLFGAVIPTANFEPITWVLDTEKLNIALGHVSASSTQRIVKLSSVCINQMSRFLSPDDATIAYAAIQKPIMYLNTDIQQETIPVSTISYPVAGEIEDTATNSLLVAQHLNKIIDDLYQLMGFELMHASQAVDLKKRQTPALMLGSNTQQLYTQFRRVVPFLQKDRELTPDIRSAYQFSRTWSVPNERQERLP